MRRLKCAPACPAAVAPAAAAAARNRSRQTPHARRRQSPPGQRPPCSPAAEGSSATIRRKHMKSEAPQRLNAIQNPRLPAPTTWHVRVRGRQSFRCFSASNPLPVAATIFSLGAFNPSLAAQVGVEVEVTTSPAGGGDVRWAVVNSRRCAALMAAPAVGAGEAKEAPAA